MKALLSALLLLPLLFASGQAQCPAPTELRNPNPNGTRVCAEMYTDDSPYYDLCCRGSLLMVLEGEDQPYMPAAFDNKVSSLVVAQRCELAVWDRKGKVGTTRKFKAGAFPRLQEFKLGLFANWDNAISAYYCKCN